MKHTDFTRFVPQITYIRVPKIIYIRLSNYLYPSLKLSPFVPSLPSSVPQIISILPSNFLFICPDNDLYSSRLFRRTRSPFFVSWCFYTDRLCTLQISLRFVDMSDRSVVNGSLGTAPTNVWFGSVQYTPYTLFTCSHCSLWRWLTGSTVVYRRINILYTEQGHRIQVWELDNWRSLCTVFVLCLWRQTASPSIITKYNYD